jgi:hypothetical protein
MTIVPVLAGAALAAFGLAMLVRPRIGLDWRHPLGDPLPPMVIRATGLLLAVAGLWLVTIFVRS